MPTLSLRTASVPSFISAVYRQTDRQTDLLLPILLLLRCRAFRLSPTLPLYPSTLPNLITPPYSLLLSTGRSLEVIFKTPGRIWLARTLSVNDAYVGIHVENATPQRPSSSYAGITSPSRHGVALARSSSTSTRSTPLFWTTPPPPLCTPPPPLCSPTGLRSYST